MYKKNFNLMIIGQIISIFGAALLRFALSLYVLDLTGSESIFATIFMVSGIPVLLAPLGGVIADRFNRRNLMVIFDFTSSGIILIFSLLLPLMSGSILLIGTVMVLLGIISALYFPTVTASIPLLVEESKLGAANGIVNAVQALSMVVAPIIGGFLYDTLSIQAVVIFCGVAFFLSAVMEIFIKIPFRYREQTEGMISTISKDLKEGFSFAVKQPLILRSMIMAVILNFLLTPLFIVGAPIIFRVTMSLNESMYGIGMGIVNSAMIIGALTAGIFTRKLVIAKVWRWILVITAFFIPVSIAVSPLLLNLNGTALGVVPPYILLLMCLVPISAICTVLSIFIITFVQKETPNELLGKVMSIIQAVAQCAAPLGQLLYGGLLENFRGVTYIPMLMIGGAMLVLTFIVKRIFK